MCAQPNRKDRLHRLRDMGYGHRFGYKVLCIGSKIWFVPHVWGATSLCGMSASSC